VCTTGDRPRSLVRLIRVKITVEIFVRHSVGPSIFRDHSCAGARSEPQLATSAPKKGLQKANNLDDQFFEADSFMDWCPKLKGETEAAMAPYKGKKAKQPKITLSSLQSSLSFTAMHSASFDPFDNFQPKTPKSSQ
jgi:hypothetical protein